MKHSQRTAILASVVTIGLLLFAATTQADQWDKKTILTINEPLQIPKMVLAPGTYVLKLVESQSNRHIVRVMNSDETQVITTILAIPNYRLQPTGKSAFGFWEMPAGSPPALRSWFYPGDNFGQEFAYPKAAAAIVTATTLTPQAVVPIDPAEAPAETKAATPPPAPVETAPDPAPTPVPPAAQTPTTTPPAPIPSSDRLYDSTLPTIRRLPETASNSPLLVMVGLMSMGMALAVRTIRMP